MWERLQEMKPIKVFEKWMRACLFIIKVNSEEHINLGHI